MAETTLAPRPGAGSLVVYVYPTISPQIVVVPIVSCIIVFPVLVLIVICALRYRAMRARRYDKRARGRLELKAAEHASRSSNRALRFNDGRAVVQCKNGRRKTIVRFKPMPELDLDTVVEERSEFDAEVNAIELLNTPEDPNHLCVINHPVSFKSFRFGYGASGELLNKRNYNYASKPVGSPVPKKNSEEKDKELYFDFSNDFQISSSERESSPNHSLSKASAASTSSAIIPIVSDSVIVINECSEKSSEDERNDLKQSAAITSLISGSELRVPSTRGQFIIPSVSVQPYFDDASDDSISFIDKSEEVELVSDSDCYKSKGETKCQIESNEEQHENIVKESVLQLDEISQRKHDISSNEIDENNSSSFKLLNTCPERNHKPTELDFTNSELGPNYCNTLSKQSCNIMIMNNYQKSIQEKVRTDYESEFYDSDEV